MKRNREIKNDALNALDGHWGWAILVSLIFGFIVAIVEAPNSLGSVCRLALAGGGMQAAITAAGLGLIGSTFTLFAGIFFSNPLNVGYRNSIKEFYKNGDYHTVGNLFKFSFADKQYWRNLAGILLVNLFITLWTLLFIIPGIIKSLAYAMTPYILRDNPELGPNEARLKSIEMMRGHKWKLFGLELSFIGWILLATLSLGIGFIWLSPYMATANAAFYCNLKEEYDSKTAITE